MDGLSLDEIIKKKKVGSNGKPGKGIAKKFTLKKVAIRKPNKPILRATQSRPIDARLKIVQKNRAKIRDARDKLVEITRIKGDARRLIEKRRPVRNSRFQEPFRNGVRSNGRNGRLELTIGRNNPKPMIRRTSNLVDIPRGYIDYDNMERIEQEEYNIARGLSRTVHNDMPSRMDTYSPPRAMSPPPLRRVNSWGSQASEHFDPFEVYEVPASRRERRGSPGPLPPPPPKGILRPSARQHSPDMYQRRYIQENPSHLSYEMRSRLETAPDPHQSMGIFSNPLRSEPGMPPRLASSYGYRIVVSNLNPTVTQSDIKELFEDIGELYDSRIVRPGVAEVIYKSLADAEKAVDTYHNRQLDRQPMKCLLVNPRVSDKPTAPAMKSSSSSNRPGKTPLEIDIDALHKVLFRRH